MASILEDQRKLIKETIREWKKKGDDRQLLLFPADELRQLAADRRYQEDRLTRIDEELRTEPDRIRDAYKVSTSPRIEPVGIVYLWPQSG